MPDIQLTDRILAQLDQVILGKSNQLRLALTCLLARGHLLIEDLPGMGKTTLAHALARTLGLQFQRIQFTSDLLPADILGVSIYDQEAHRFSFHPGPVFSQVVLADEINRATPKAQSALLEAMEEQQVTVEGETRHLPEPFFVIATQNPAQQIGTFPLPESQLDRFLMRLELGYPDAVAERELLKGRDRRDLLATLEPVTGPRQLVALQQAVGTNKVSDPLVDYVQALLQYTREPARYHLALSPRGGLALLRAAQAWSLLAGRDYVLPDDVQAVLPAVAGHRLHPVEDEGLHPAEVVARLIAQVPIP
ncbi:MAG TPA: MoxR family ATPase [Thioalkalivibrio sp.]|nr:MoxR family ATPase [Thioalkalivibrio sp.]